MIEYRLHNSTQMSKVNKSANRQKSENKKVVSWSVTKGKKVAMTWAANSRQRLQFRNEAEEDKRAFSTNLLKKQKKR